jgi:hypothetical protein
MEVTLAAAAPVRAKANTPVARDFVVTAVLSIGRI